jgi:hypothetical protein
MRLKGRITLLVSAGLLIATGWCAMAFAQLAPTASLSDELAAQYKLVKMGADSNGLAVTEPGTVLMVKKGGVLSFPPNDVAVLPTKYENGSIHSPNAVMTGLFKQNVATRFLTAGERVYVTKLDINMKAGKISFSIVECDSCNGVQQPAFYKAQVNFQFAKGYLESANPADVETTIGQVLAIDEDPQQGGDAQGGQDQGGQQAAAPEPEKPAATVNIAVGQTVEQVKAALGAPQKTVNLGTKQILVYKDLKITFVKGKVTDVE